MNYNFNNNKEFMGNSESLLKIIEGAKSNSNDILIKESIDCDKLNLIRERAISLRKVYEKKRNESRSAFSEYKTTTEEVKKELKRIKNLIYAFYGKSNPKVLDFGIKKFL